MLKFTTLFLFLFSFNTFSQISFCNKDLETFPTQAGGREKPLYVLAEDTVKFITGNSKIDDHTATEAFCRLSLMAFGMPNTLTVNVRVDHVDVRKFLKMKEDQTQEDINKIINLSSDIKTELAKLKENNSYKKELNKVDQRLGTYRAIIEGRAWTVPVEKENKIDFITISEFLTQSKVASYRQKTDNPLKMIFDEAKSLYLTKNGDKYLMEYKYFKWQLTSFALIFSLLAIILLVSLKNHLPGTILIVLSLGIQIFTLILRVLISGRAPVTNMYETVMFSGLGALFLGSIISLYRKEKMFAISGLGYNILCLMMMKFAHGMLDEGISPLVPVLRDNFWLSTHVTTVILSYAALALSWILANALLVRVKFFSITKDEVKYQTDLVYTCIKYGVVMLAAGIILGGVWADYSWGRFWGWDPKETWSLIVLLVYMAILHGKYTTWIPSQRFIPLVAGAFMSVMMAWFGVNYILASGLHSYGFSEGGAVFLGSFFTIQILVLILTSLRKKSGL
jgi:cytochrome c-type biogenesis protein CcsB